jgi:hypothetical protein
MFASMYTPAPGGSMDSKGRWVAVYLTTDGPQVVGPFLWEKDALHSIPAHYVGMYGESVEEAQARYDESGDEWVTRLQES